MELTVILKSHLKEKPIFTIRDGHRITPLSISQHYSGTYINRGKINLEQKPYTLSVLYLDQEIERKIHLRNDFMIEFSYDRFLKRD